MTHLDMTSPKILHFLSRVRTSLAKRTKNRRKISITHEVNSDLKLLPLLRTTTNKGTNLNIYIFRCPTISYRVDAYPEGIEDFSHSGRA